MKIRIVKQYELSTYKLIEEILLDAIRSGVGWDVDFYSAAHVAVKFVDGDEAEFYGNKGTLQDIQDVMEDVVDIESIVWTTALSNFTYTVKFDKAYYSVTYEGAVNGYCAQNLLSDHLVGTGYDPAVLLEGSALDGFESAFESSTGEFENTIEIPVSDQKSVLALYAWLKGLADKPTSKEVRVKHASL